MPSANPLPAGVSYKLLNTSTRPQKELSDPAATVGKAGLANAVLVQELASLRT